MDYPFQHWEYIPPEGCSDWCFGIWEVEPDVTHRTWLPDNATPPRWIANMPACATGSRLCAAPLTFHQTCLTFPGDLKIWSLPCWGGSCALPSSQRSGRPAARFAHEASPHTISLTRSATAALHAACLLELTGSLLKSFCFHFPPAPSCRVFLHASTQAEERGTEDMREGSGCGVGGRESKKVWAGDMFLRLQAS